MNEDSFDSSDSARTGRPLRHARYTTLAEPLALELGGTLSEVQVCYETYGELNEEKSNAVLICHALSGDSHVARHDTEDDHGWWDIMVGPGRPIDTGKHFVVCPNLLGGCRGTTGPKSRDPATGKRYGKDFPEITVRDMVEVQRRLVAELGVEKLLAVVGGSIGGHQALCWATEHPEQVEGAIGIATSPRMTSQALAFDVVGRNAILHDPNFHDGQYYDKEVGPNVGLAIARMIGHITYLSREAMQEKFEADRYAPRDVATTFEKAFSVGSYLGYQGDRFVERFDANSYVTLTKAMDLFDIGDTAEDLEGALRRSRCRWLFVSFTSDWLFPPAQSRVLVDALLACDKEVSYCNVQSPCGHDAFLLENNIAVYGGMVEAFLDDLSGERPRDITCCTRGDEAEGASDAVSIFRRDRLDYDRIMTLIPKGSSVLDLGCGQGGLLCRLSVMGHRKLVGVELDEQAILASLRRGLNVVQADINRRLSQFRDGQFDVVVLSQTLQAVLDVEGVLTEMLRIGRRGIVSFPNLGYRKFRERLEVEGRAPETAGAEQFTWYNTPNLRFLSIADFEDLCREKGFRIHQTVALDTEAGRDVVEEANLNADLAIFVLSR